MKKLFLFILIFLAILNFQFLIVGCANIVPPQGGFKDTLPPNLVKANPGDSTRNFKSNRISFSFDEFVDVENVQENLIVSPTPKISPTVDYKLNTVSVKIKDTLEPNTTYSYNFGNAIKDVNEGNVMKDFTYIFSTGPYIDSMQLPGQVLLAESGKADSTLIVMLHTKSDDSVVIKEKPRYVTRLDSMGRFTFKNLPPGTFYLYAMKDEGGTRRYLSNKQLFAFADRPVIVDQRTEPVTLFAYIEKETEETKSTSSLEGLNLGNRKKITVSSEKRLKYSSKLTSNRQDLLNDFILSFEQPLRLFDSTKLQLFADSTYTPVPSYTIIKDSTSKEVRLVNAWVENSLYHLILDKDFADDSSGNKLLKTDTISFYTFNLADYGSVKMKFLNLDLSKNPVLQFVANGNVFKTFPLKSTSLEIPLFVPGDYELRMLFDDNKNGKWDPGEFFEKHIQPEIVRPFNRDKITIKNSWENEFDLEAPLK